MKNPIVITSLEEDFKKIGLIRDTAPAAPVVVENDEQLDEKRVAVAMRDGQKTRQKKTSAAKKRQSRKYRKSAAGKKAARRRARKMKKPSFLRRLKKLAMKAFRLGTRKEESVEQSAENFDRAEALKSLANSAIIAEKLANFFEGYVDSFVDTDMELSESVESSLDVMADIAGACEELAEAFAERAEALHEGQDVAVTEFFQEGLEFILDAVDLHESILAEMDEEEDEEDEDEDEEMEDEDEEEEDEGK